MNNRTRSDDAYSNEIDKNRSWINQEIQTATKVYTIKIYLIFISLKITSISIEIVKQQVNVQWMN